MKQYIKNLLISLFGRDKRIVHTFVVNDTPLVMWPCFAREHILRNPYGIAVTQDLIVLWDDTSTELIKADDLK